MIRMNSYRDLILSLLVIGAACIATSLVSRDLRRKGNRVSLPLNILLVLAVASALCLVGTSWIWVCKGIAFALILLYASVSDYTKREADDCLWVMILLLSLCNVSNLSIWSMVGGVMTTFVPTFAITVLVKNGFGGAEIKIAGAAGWMLGFVGGSAGYIAGLLLAILIQPICNRVMHRSNQQPFPMLPFLSCGLMLGYFITR